MRPIAAASAALSLTAIATAQTWQRVGGVRPGPMTGAFDLHRGRLVLFQPDGETFELADTTLLHRAAHGPVPPARGRAGLVYDSARRHVLLFGGEQTNGVLGDTWSWDGVQWQPLVAPLSPPARVGQAMAFDTVRGQVVLFGGTSPTTVFTDTWIHDGVQWQQLQPASSPPGTVVQMTFDAGRGVGVLLQATSTFAGVARVPVTVWEWDGVGWNQRALAVTPRARNGACLTYDPVRSRVVYADGDDAARDHWEFDGVVWALVSANNPSWRQDAVAWFDPRFNQVRLYGGYDVVSILFSPHPVTTAGRSDLRAVTAAGMQPVAPDSAPPTRLSFDCTYDAARANFVVFGGAPRYGAFTGDTWTFDGMRWEQRAPAGRPAARTGQAMTFDSVRGDVLLFGGMDSMPRDDLWVWNGTNWRQLVTPTAPSPRVVPAFAFDPTRGVAVLFGGFGLGVVSQLDDTWEWNGAGWLQRTVTTRPAGRQGAALVFDPVRNRMVLFGGMAWSPVVAWLTDTWEWDGVQWRRINVPAPPPPLAMPSLTFEPASARCVLTGLTNLAATPRLRHLWDYDGTTWRMRQPPTATLAEALDSYHDPRRDRLCLYDGVAVQEWTAQPAQLVSLGSPCGTGARLFARERPRLGGSGFGVEVASTPTPAAFVLGTAPAAVPVGNGCTLLVGGTVATGFAVPDVRGTATWLLPLPLRPALRGLVFHAQAAVLQPAMPGGLALTQGLQLTLGD